MLYFAFVDEKYMYIKYFFSIDRFGAKGPPLAINWLIYNLMFTLQENYGELNNNINDIFDRRQVKER